ncbi:receptor-like protein EIX1 [Mangifera indica]|uniref:receptor-like protein EIX1 n=1 Tax=Mangifera indica TaxID=29780 RepID=UPI001CFB307B|nr:receptor-like protein EIX1 [Mangifera indica]
MRFIVAFLFLSIATINLGFCNGSSNHSYLHGCIESERRALLRFKNDLKDSSKRLASWTSGDGDCCTWAGVLCDNFTGHVLQLHLGNPNSIYILDHASEADYEAFQRSKLVGKINPSLIELKQLIHLDLSFNDFQGIEIPKFLGSMKNLIYLNLSGAGFQGMIAHQIGNLSNLQYLDLNVDHLSVDNLRWLSGLSLLKYLDLSSVNNIDDSDWLSVVNTLPSLLVLKLSDCGLRNEHLVLSTVNFSSLTFLDLSYNELEDSFIFSWVLGQGSLVFLDLSYNSLSGPIPDGLQNMTSLRHLDLSWNNFNSTKPTGWWHQFVHLEYLFLQQNFLKGTIPEDLGNLTSLKVLDLSSNFQLEWRIPRSWGSLCNLISFSLSGVNLLSQDISEIFDIFLGCAFKKLELLDLKFCRISGKLTSKLGKFKNLKRLFLGFNSISGHISSSLGELSSLIRLNLFHNNLSGSIPESLGKLSSLEYLDISYNSLNGFVLPIHFENLSKLSIFYASGNSLTMKVDPDWLPPFQLESLYLASCKLGPHFPSWILSQKYLVDLDISNSGISDLIPSRFWKYISGLQFLNLSRNQIYGVIPDLYEVPSSLDFSWNNLSGQLPFISFNVLLLDLSNNYISGSIKYFLCSRMNKSKQMKILSLENNLLSGELPDCWMHWKNLTVLKLNNNKFIGSLPSSMGSLSSLQSLHLRNNCFSGIIPVSFRGLTQLITLDLGENNFFGKVPRWIGERFSSLMILNLRSNKFHGHLPMKLCCLSSLQVLDLADNNLDGSIPKCINDFSAMVTIYHSPSFTIRYYASHYQVAGTLEDAIVAVKGKLMEYNTILYLVRNIDLSNNKFTGEIPVEVTELKGLQSLNLSHNFLTGKIPENIGEMKSLESIDFSVNQLRGNIPESMSSLNFLGNLNLSNNHLTGKIPSGTQLQTFDASSFINNELCGLPLPTKCTKIVRPPAFENGGLRDGNEHEVDWFYVGMSLGFVMGFWGIILGPLIVSRRWRYKYCHFLNFLGNKFGIILRKCC